MRIGFVIFSLRVGGAERVAVTLVNEWVRQGEEVTLLTIDSRDRDFYTLDPRVGRVDLKLNVASNGWCATVIVNLRRLAKMRNFARSHKFDLIITFGDKTNILLLLATLGLRLPIIVSEHTDPRKYNIGLIACGLRRIVYPLASMVVVLTEEIGEWARTLVRSEAVRVIPNPISKSCQPEPRSFRRGPRYFVLAMGRMGHEKGFDLLLEAFALCAGRFPDWTLRLVGQGEELERLRALAQQLGIDNVVDFEPVTKEPEKAFRTSDLFVLSSRFEGFPMVLLEAMACGLPVVSFDCMSGPREMICHGVNGILVPPEDICALASAMELLMSNEHERRRLAERASEVLARFGLARVMDIWSEVLTDAIEESTGEPPRDELRTCKRIAV